jgi:heterodisulfide reductase subunit A
MTVEEVLCRGCGICAAACPGGAISIRHYSRDAVNAEIAGLLKSGGN